MPLHKTKPSVQKVMVGKPALIECTSDYGVQWTFHNVLITQQPNINFYAPASGKNIHTLKILSVTTNDYGSYTCLGKLKTHDEYTTFYSVANVEPHWVKGRCPVGTIITVFCGIIIKIVTLHFWNCFRVNCYKSRMP